MAKLGTLARPGTLKDNYIPDINILIATGIAKAFLKDYYIWSDAGNTSAMRKKAREGLKVRVYAGFYQTTINEYNNGFEMCDLHAYINVVVDGWRSDVHGLIYTDETFVKEMKRIFAEHGIPNNIGYTEQGMQGENFVSMEGDTVLLKWLFKTYGKKIGVDYYKREEKRTMCLDKINVATNEIKALKIGARNVNNSRYSSDAAFVFRKPYGEVTRLLTKNGWKTLETDVARMVKIKNDIKIALYRKNARRDARIYLSVCQ